MRVTDQQLNEVRERGYTVVEDFLKPQLLQAAQNALWEIYPTPEDYFADPTAHARYASSQFAGLRLYPYPSWALNRLAVHPQLISAAQRLCGTNDLHLYKIELWAKYSGAIDYDQNHHFDYGNHSLVVPRRASSHLQMTSFILLSDVTAEDGPTRIVPARVTADLPLVPREQLAGAYADEDVAITGPAGSLFIYRTDILHRGTNFAAPDRSRFVMLVDYQPRGWPWTGKMAWPNHSISPHWAPALSRMSPYERTLFGFPGVGDAYWDEQTLRDVGLRYPEMDMTPYQR